VELKIAFESDMWSTPVKYLYYDSPKVVSIDPACGPEEGYTQIAVHGEDFADLGRNKAMCVFNHTIYTNATVMSPELIYCDSPAYLNERGYSYLSGEDTAWYHVQVTIDGGNVVTGTPQIFRYYQQTQVVEVTPNSGPLSGNTQIAVKAKGIRQPGVCGPVKVRLGTYEFVPEISSDGTLNIRNEEVRYPGHVVVQVTFNGQ